MQELAGASANVSSGPVPRTGRWTRLWGLLWLVVAGSLLATAAYVKPDPHGVGTHQQLGLAPCGMLLRTGLPCPTCGMTTAFAYTVRGRLLAAFLAQPAGLLLALLAGFVASCSLHAIVRGRWPVNGTALLLRTGLTPNRAFAILLGVLLVAWGFKLALGLATRTLPYLP